MRRSFIACLRVQGYNTWYDLMCTSAMNETTVRATADALVSLGLAELGYQYINLDDCELQCIAACCRS